VDVVCEDTETARGVAAEAWGRFAEAELDISDSQADWWGARPAVSAVAFLRTADGLAGVADTEACSDPRRSVIDGETTAVEVEVEAEFEPEADCCDCDLECECECECDNDDEVDHDRIGSAPLALA
jgi:hypothetical protein